MVQIAAGAPGTSPSAGSAHDRPATVSDLTGRTRRVVESALGEVWVVGEIASWTCWSGSGHRYFSLRDTRAQLRGCMYRDAAARLPADPEVGMRVLIRGTVTVYTPRGDLQLRAHELRTEDGRGLWELARERLRVQLHAEGLLDPQRKRRLPRHPSRIGIVTSPHGAALQDILSVLARRYPCVEVILSPTRVQGPGAEQEIARALRALAQEPAIDVAIVGRGGGSAEDLWPFNAELVVRALAESPVPTISAVGHETDVTLADLVADVRAPTPSAAAELVVPDRAELLRKLLQVYAQTRQHLQRLASERADQLAQLRAGLEPGLHASLRSSEERLQLLRPDHLAAMTAPALDRAAHQLHALGASTLRGHLCTALERTGRRLATHAPASLGASIQAYLARLQHELEMHRPDSLGRSAGHLLRTVGTSLESAVAELEALSPRAAMRRGWAILRNEHGMAVRTANAVAPGDHLRLLLADGEILTQVLATHPHKETHDAQLDIATHASA